MIKRLISLFNPGKSSSVISEGSGYWWNNLGGGSYDTGAGETVGQGTINRSAAAFACTKALSETIAGLPDMIYNRKRDGTKTVDQNHRVTELLSLSPNEEMSAFVFWELLVSRTLNWGNFFAEIQRDGADRPVALWPIHPSRVTPLRMVDGSLYFEITLNHENSAEYTDPTWRRENIVHLPSRNMLNCVGFGSTNGVIGPGLLPSVAEEIGIESAARRYGAEFFRKGGQPLGMVEHPGFISDSNKRERFRRDINLAHTKNEVGVLWHDAKYKQISLPPDQAQFIESRKLSRQNICQFYGVCPSIIGDMEHSKYATADQAIRQFVMITLRNLAVRVEHCINRQILHTPGEGKLERTFKEDLMYKLALDSLLRGDPKTKAETDMIYRTSGVKSGNDIRHELDMNPIPKEDGGDMLIVNGGMAELSKINEQGERQSQPATNEEPKVNHNKLIEMLSEKVAQTQTVVQVRGWEPEPEADLSILVDTCVETATTALDRIHSITLNQIERWRTQDPAKVEAKLPEFILKQDSRLQDALDPAKQIGSKIGADIPAVAAAYSAKLESLDSHSLFSFVEHGIDVAAIIRESTSC